MAPTIAYATLAETNTAYWAHLPQNLRLASGRARRKQEAVAPRGCEG
jgi:hypothetical protein